MKNFIRYCTVLLFAPMAALHAGEPAPAGPMILPAMVDVLTETWRAAEITFESANTYTNPLIAAELNVLFTSPSGKQVVVPGFWDGCRTWRVRFAPTEYGVWKYVSTCTDIADGGLHGKRGTVGANRYQGSLEIYRRGFLRTAPGVRYFMYADGTPFFYLGDTHWSMPKEPFDEMFKPIVNKRVTQGFTVYQSEPLSAKYNFADGFSEADLPGLQDLDRRFNFFTSMEWWKLTPRFDDPNWFQAESSAWYSLASIDSDVYVLYLYNRATTSTGTLRHMRNTSHVAQWFNTSTGVYMNLGTFTPERDAQSEGYRWKIPAKPTAADWVLVVKASAKGSAD